MGDQAHAAERRRIRFEKEIKPQSESMKCHCGEDSLHDDSDGCMEDRSALPLLRHGFGTRSGERRTEDEG